MTREEILQMEAGPEMDLLVGKEVLELSVEDWNKRFFANQTNYSGDMSAAWHVKNAVMPYFPSYFVKQIRSLIRKKTGEDAISTTEILEHLDAKMICQAALLTALE